MSEPYLALTEQETLGVYLLLRELEGGAGASAGGAGGRPQGFNRPAGVEGPPGHGAGLAVLRAGGAPDAVLLRLLNRIERLLYERLTIQELENIEQVYRDLTSKEKEGKR